MGARAVSKSVSNVNINECDTVCYPDEFGLLSHLASNEDFTTLPAAVYENSGIIGAVCHGPAALLPTKLSNGEDLIASKIITGYHWPKTSKCPSCCTGYS